ncbi:MAG: ATP-binding protein, partial [Muribaculaceae bacterium]|nr:ATP-binding protein [Muribaculaceae bacterium]
MISWQDKAIKLLDDSLSPIPQELNGIDWKCALSDKSEKLAQHLCAFSNTKNGGFIVFGINNDDASFVKLTKDEVEEITKKLGNIAKNNLAWSVQLEHDVLDYKGNALLFVRIPEQTNKPIYLRGKDIYEAYIRSAGHSVKMSHEQVHGLIAQSHGLTFEDRVAKIVNSADDVLNLLDYKLFFEMLHKIMPTEKAIIIKQLEDYGLIVSKGDSYEIL